MPSLSEDELLEGSNYCSRFTTTAAGPMEVLNMDYEGPFPEYEYGNTYVLTIIDTFSRAVGLYAVPNVEAHHAARMLVRHIGILSDCV